MQQPGRKYSAGSSYRYGFNRKENDNDVKGEGNQQDYGMRIYDPRLCRFLSVDPITKQYPALTPYQFASNRPIDGVDLDGLEWTSWDMDSRDPNVKVMLDWARKDGEAGAKLLDNKYYNAFDAQRNRFSGNGGIVDGMAFAFGEAIVFKAFRWLFAATKTTKPIIFLIKASDAVTLRANQVSGFLGKLFKSPINVPKLFENAGVENITVTKGTSSEMTAVIGQGAERVEEVSRGLKNAEILKPSKDAEKAWGKLLNDYKDKQIPDEIVKGTQLYKENVEWIEQVKKKGYDILDIGPNKSGTSSTFYSMEKSKVY
jgi:RHS repeat-associated protein